VKIDKEVKERGCMRKTAESSREKSHVSRELKEIE
jgi:hypothetical protein